MSGETFTAIIFIGFIISFFVGLMTGRIIWHSDGDAEYNRGYADAISKALKLRRFDERWLR